MKKLILLFAIILYAAGCETTDLPEETPKPAGYQEDIPWPSLADSPWPMFRADPQNTGRSRLKLSKKTFSVTNTITSGNLQAGIVLGNNSVYYNNSLPSLIYSLDRITLAKNWENIIGMESLTTPLLAGEFVITTGNNSVFCFNYSGDTLWTFETSESYIYQRTLNIDKDGNIYLVSGKTLYKISGQGELLGQLTDNSFALFNTIAFSPDGKVLYLQGDDVSLLAVDINSLSVKWNYGSSRVTVPPAVDDDGNVYIFPWTGGKLVSLTPEGALKWEFAHNEKMDAVTAEAPAIGKTGDVYFGLDTLYSVSHEGKLNWKLDITSDGSMGTGSDISSITVDADDNLLIGTYDNRLLLVSAQGNLIHEIKLTDTGKGVLPAIITVDKIYAPIYDGKNIFILE